jgi:prevent-host-death family protein
VHKECTGDAVLDIGRDIHPLSDFKRKTGELIEQLKDTGRPVVLTLNGRPELVVQNAAAYQTLLDRLRECESELQSEVSRRAGPVSPKAEIRVTQKS